MGNLCKRKKKNKNNTQPFENVCQNEVKVLPKDNESNHEGSHNHLIENPQKPIINNYIGDPDSSNTNLNNINNNSTSNVPKDNSISQKGTNIALTQIINVKSLKLPNQNKQNKKMKVASSNIVSSKVSFPKSLGHKPTLTSNSVNVNYKTFIIGKAYSVLVQEYDLMEHLGAGAFGVVQKVRHKSSGQIRAMKTIKKQNMYDANSIKEIENLMLLDHPNILKLYEFFYDNQYLYVITEYCEGGELFDVIKERNGYFSEKDAATILKSVLQAVAYCHSRHLVHRDLKPENILLEGNSLENIKLIDFGTGNLIAPNQKFKERLGTAYYIAPEVLKKNYDEKCDLWSIGVIMYILLTGEPPFNGSTDSEILQNVKMGTVNFNSNIFNEVSDEAKDLLKQLLRRDPTKRISAIESLKHSWIKHLAPNSKINIDVASKVFNNLSTFQAEKKLQEAAVAFIVNQLVSKEETEELRRIFVNLDSNCDGVLSREELESGLIQYYGGDKAKKQTDEIFRKVDADKNGFISYDEFIRASIDKVKLLSEEKLKAAYQLFDKNGDGSIEAKEIKEVLGRDFKDDEKIWSEIVKEVDRNGDGTISYEEFKLMMENICK